MAQMQQTHLGENCSFCEVLCLHTASFFLQTLVLLCHQTFCITFSDAITPRFSAHFCRTFHQEIHELKDQIQDVEIKYTQNLKEAKV